MHICFLADPLEHFKIYKDSTFAMMEAAQARGHSVWFAEAGTLARLGDGVVATGQSIRLTGDTPNWYDYLGDNDETQPLSAFDAVVMRKDPPFDAEYLYATHLLSLAEAAGARVFNSGRAIREHNEKLAILKYPQFIAPTVVTPRLAELRAFLAEHGEIVVKPLDGMGGESVFYVHQGDRNVGAILETITWHETRTVMAQRYLPSIVDGDKRVLLINGKPVDYCLARIPQGGELRGNLAAGGRGEARPLSARDREIAETLGPQLAAQGLLLVGLDVIGDTLTEINVTSPTCFREIMDQTGLDVAGLFIEALETACA